VGVQGSDEKDLSGKCWIRSKGRDECKRGSRFCQKGVGDLGLMNDREIRYEHKGGGGARQKGVVNRIRSYVGKQLKRNENEKCRSPCQGVGPRRSQKFRGSGSR